eukprot:TRINITY_DN3179_c0_g1_i1.p1 TRINITY_DN3179_c0_g1~~TRINITY_DN3179_c0_g1_i1.p1  ORF type:complete len:113 (+),score=39.63 TRINITY_DN3179_c0_g1_i1:153-491(+)
MAPKGTYNKTALPAPYAADCPLSDSECSTLYVADSLSHNYYSASFPLLSSSSELHHYPPLLFFFFFFFFFGGGGVQVVDSTGVTTYLGHVSVNLPHLTGLAWYPLYDTRTLR